MSQEQCNIWSWFLVLLCKIISPSLFFIVLKFSFFGAVRGVKGNIIARLLSKHFCLQLFFAKDWVFLLFALITISMKCSQGGHQSEIPWVLSLHIAGKFISNTLIVCIGVSTPLRKNTTPSMLPNRAPLIKSTNCPSPLFFRQSSLYIGFLWPTLKVGSFSEPPKY